MSWICGLRRVLQKLVWKLAVYLQMSDACPEASRSKVKTLQLCSPCGQGCSHVIVSYSPFNQY
eukprot:1661070-Amphidinium_carterae.1